MTWLTGTTTWANLASDLTKLACGEIADGAGVTCAVGDRWSREFVGVDTIRTPASADVASGNMSNRTGYFSLIVVPGLTRPGDNTSTAGSGPASVCRVTNPYTTDPSTSGFHRWIARVQVSTANSVAGNYSTAQVNLQVWDADNGVQLLNSNLTPSSAGLVPASNGLQFTVSDPSGLLTAGTYWVRAFTSTYMYGIDYWPVLHRRAATPTFSVAPPGVQGTDWDLVEQAAPGATSGFVNTSPRNAPLFHGLGIKTATGLGAPGALYTVAFPMALIKARIFNTTTNGILGLDVGRSLVDTVNGSVLRNPAGLRTQNWCRAFQTAASVTSTAAVQYWMSVTPTGIVLALGGDPAATGKLGTAFIAAFTPYDSTYDVFPVAYNAIVLDYAATDVTGDDFAFSLGGYGYWRTRRAQDGSEGTRDWQTRWMRADFDYATYSGAYWSGSHATDVTTTASSGSHVGACVGVGSSPSLQPSGYLPARQNKPNPIDGKWWMYGFQLSDWGKFFGSAEANTSEGRLLRGYINSRFLYVPSDGWANGDELTDSATSIKYLLMAPDYAGECCGERLRTNSNQFFGGVAIAEL